MIVLELDWVGMQDARTAGGQNATLSTSVWQQDGDWVHESFYLGVGRGVENKVRIEIFCPTVQI